MAFFTIFVPDIPRTIKAAITIIISMASIMSFSDPVRFFQS
jgi:hypothetical protein